VREEPSPQPPACSVLVIGGAGYIGSSLVRDLLADGHPVRVLDSLLFGEGPIRDLYGQPAAIALAACLAILWVAPIVEANRLEAAIRYAADEVTRKLQPTGLLAGLQKKTVRLEESTPPETRGFAAGA